MQRIGVLGSGVVGRTLAAGCRSRGYEVRIGSRTPAKLAEFAATSGIQAGSFAEVAAWGEAMILAVQGAGAKEALDLMVNPVFSGGRPTMFYCGNDAEAKAVVARILEQFGWEAADMGTATAARAIEPLCQLWGIPRLLRNHWRS